MSNPGRLACSVVILNCLTQVSYPSVPVVSMSQGPVQASLNAVQTYLQDLQYPPLYHRSLIVRQMLFPLGLVLSHDQFFDSPPDTTTLARSFLRFGRIDLYQGNRGFCIPVCIDHCTYIIIIYSLRLMEVAKDMIQESLPIKCLESVVLSLYLTAPLTEVQRFAVSFKSRCGELCYRHIVLGVHYSGFYGALGLSRREDLMFKPLQYKVIIIHFSSAFTSSFALLQSLYDLVHDFMQSYSNCEFDGHQALYVCAPKGNEI